MHVNHSLDAIATPSMHAITSTTSRPVARNGKTYSLDWLVVIAVAATLAAAFGPSHLPRDRLPESGAADPRDVDVCETKIHVQSVGQEPSKVVLVAWSSNEGSGPMKVECTGLLSPGASWALTGAQVPSGTHHAAVFSFTAKRFSELGLDDDLGFDDVAADYMCASLYFGLPGDSDAYARFKSAFDNGTLHAGVPMNRVGGAPVVAAVSRRCPDDVAPGVDVSSSYMAIGGPNTGPLDPLMNAYAYHAPAVYSGHGGLTSTLRIQNAGSVSTEVQVRVRAMGDDGAFFACAARNILPGDAVLVAASDCSGPGWRGQAWIVSDAAPVAVTIDTHGLNALSTYEAVPALDPHACGGAGLPCPSVTSAQGPLIHDDGPYWETTVNVQAHDSLSDTLASVSFFDAAGALVEAWEVTLPPRGASAVTLSPSGQAEIGDSGSVEVRSLAHTVAGASPGATLGRPATFVSAVVEQRRWVDGDRTGLRQSAAYNLGPPPYWADWQPAEPGELPAVAAPALEKDIDGSGTSTELATTNLVTTTGTTAYDITLFDQNGPLGALGRVLGSRQTDYFVAQIAGEIGNGFKGSALVSASAWTHGTASTSLAAVLVGRTGTLRSADIPGDELAASMGAPLRRAISVLWWDTQEAHDTGGGTQQALVPAANFSWRAVPPPATPTRRPTLPRTPTVTTTSTR